MPQAHEAYSLDDFNQSNNREAVIDVIHIWQKGRQVCKYTSYVEMYNRTWVDIMLL